LIGLKELFLHFLHLTLPFKTLCGSALILDLHLVQTKTFLNILFCASGILLAMNYLEKVGF